MLLASTIQKRCSSLPQKAQVCGSLFLLLRLSIVILRVRPFMFYLLQSPGSNRQFLQLLRPPSSHFPPFSPSSSSSHSSLPNDLPSSHIRKTTFSRWAALDSANIHSVMIQRYFAGQCDELSAAVIKLPICILVTRFLFCKNQSAAFFTNQTKHYQRGSQCGIFEITSF